MSDDHPWGVPSGYLLGAPVGRGSFSVVYRAVQGSTDRVVALKLLSVDGDEPTVRGRFDEERRAMGALADHPNIVTVVDADVADGRPWIAMEHCRRGSLSAIGRPLSPGEATAVLRDIGGALAVAHARDIRHRDVKPSNILLADNGAVALGDFGLARVTATQTSSSSTGSQTFTPDHVPPEVLGGKRHEPAGDVYSLGTTVWELLAGRPPFHDVDEPTLGAVMARILRGPPGSLPRDDVDPALAALVEEMTATDPTKRPAAAAVVARAAALAPTVGAGSGSPWAAVDPLTAAEVRAEASGSADPAWLGYPSTDAAADPCGTYRSPDGAARRPLPPTPGASTVGWRGRRMVLGGALAAALAAVLVVGLLVWPRVPGLTAATGSGPTSDQAAPLVEPSSIVAPTSALPDPALVAASSPEPTPGPPIDENATGGGGTPRPDTGTSGNGRSRAVAGGNGAGGSAGGGGAGAGGAGAGAAGGTTGGGTGADAPTDGGSGGNGGSPAAQAVPATVTVAGSDWQGYGGVGMSRNGSSLTLSAPVNDYSALRGAFVSVSGCDYEVAVTARAVAPDVATPGFGYAIGVRASVSGGNPHGWSQQYEYDGTRDAYFRRVVILPSGAWQTSAQTPAAPITATHRTVLRVVGNRVTATVDGASAGSFGLSGGCGSGIVLRVWGGTTRFDQVIVTRLTGDN